MAFQKPWPVRYTVSFIRMASVAVTIYATAAGIPAHADCGEGVASVEAFMQDAIVDLQAAESLLEEARAGVELETATDQQTCAFLNGSQERYTTARAGFRRCIEAMDDALENCANPDWSSLSASPHYCQTHLDTIDTQLSSLPEELAQYCVE